MTVKLYLKQHPKSHEVIEVYDECDYPTALMPLDTFWVTQEVKRDRSIYEALEQGETVTVELRMVIDPCLDPQ